MQIIPRRRLANAARRATVFLFAIILVSFARGQMAACRCASPNEPALAPFRQAQSSLCKAMDVAGGALADRVLDSVVAGAIPADLTASVGSLQNTHAQGVVDPLDLLRELEALRVCRQCGGVLAIPAGRTEALARIQDAVRSHAEQLLGSQPDPAPATRRRIAACCLVFPLLLTPEDSWDAATTAALPTWLRAGPWRMECEAFALHAGRPLTACHLSEPTPAGDAVSPYLLRAADAMAEERDYLAGLACLRAGLRLARSRNDASGVGEFACLLGERTADYGHPAEAASLLGEVLANKPTPGDPGRIVVTRMTYLYKAEDYVAVAAEADQCLNEQRYPSRRVQILYLAWASFRRLGQREKAEPLATAFLESFPTHQLAADILYAKAMEALAQADYGEAQTLLERTKRDFPESRLAKRVDELLGRLTPLTADSRPRPPAP